MNASRWEKRTYILEQIILLIQILKKKLMNQLSIMKSVRSIVVSIREEELCGTGNLNKCAKQKNRCPLASGDNEIRICAQAR